MGGSAKRLKALQKLRERLHTETEPDKLYKTLKKLSSVPILCDTLAEIGFRQTIKLLRREQLLVPFAKDLAAKWSERSPLERQAKAEPQDLALQMRLTREQAPRKPAEEDEAHEPAASRARAGDDREVVGGSRRSPQRNPDLYPAGSFEACLNYDCPSSSSTLPLGKGKKRKCPWKAEARSPDSPGAKVPRSESPNCKEQSLLPASCFPELSSSRQACLPPDGQDSSSLQSKQEAAPWACRVNLKTPVYSGPAPGPHLLPKVHQGCLAKPNCPSQPAKAQEEECRPQICHGQTTQAQAERQTHLQQQEARQVLLQGLRERIQRAQAKKSQARQAKMIPFPAKVANQSQQAATGQAGARGGGAPSKENNLPGALAPGPLQRAPRLPLGPSNKTQLKKSAPLMAKSLRDYKSRYSRR
ncbi:elongin-A3 member D-like [Chionomys nivalis]|uniref:elongin-A3 member D-like n=1 Tax=Chionomys nivalis TaxID=269649 RepID=UPI0025998AC3|nr:elongin-A3 member D-like [Chionomys nivalis]